MFDFIFIQNMQPHFIYRFVIFVTHNNYISKWRDIDTLNNVYYR